MIYALVHPDTLEIRYVGQTRVGGTKRLRAHRDNARRGCDLPVYRWWRKLDHEPSLVRLGEGGNAEEIAWIADLKSRGARLLNCTDGGDGCTGEGGKRISAALTGRKLSPEHKAAIGRAAIGNRSNTGRKLSLEHRARISRAMRENPNRPWFGKKLSAEHRAKLGRPGNQYRRGIPFTPEQKASLLALFRSPEHRFKLSVAQKARRERERN